MCDLRWEQLFDRGEKLTEINRAEFYERMDLHKCDKHVYLQTRKKRKAEIAF
jgi:sulfur transfer protein SufE